MLKAAIARRRNVLIGLAASMGSVSTGLPARAAEFVWKFGDDLGPDHSVNVRTTEAFSRILRDSGGRLDIKPYPNSMLGGAPAMIAQLRLGALEMMGSGGGTFDSLVPISSVETVAYAFRDERAAYAAMDGDLGKLIRGEFPAQGFVAMDHVYNNGFRQFTTSAKPIRNADDLQGLKLRTGVGKLYADTFRSMGVSVTQLAASEVYTALQTHLVDGQESPLALMASLRYYEVQRYCSLSRHMWSPTWFLVNRAKWESLPRDLQDIASKHINAGALLQRKDSALQDIALRDKLGRQGLVFNEVDVASFKARLSRSGYYARLRNDYGTAAWSALEKYSGPLR